MAQTRDGGKPNVKSGSYSAPQGPTNLYHNSPGLGGSNHGKGQKFEQGSGEFSGRPGIGGTRHGNKGSQGC